MRSERVMVRFEGTGQGVAELAWGQRELWTAMQRQQSWMPISTVRPLPPGTTVADLVDQLRFLMSRYQTTRTRLRFDPDGGCRQVVASRGEIPLEVVDAAESDDPAEVAGRVEQRYCETDYDFTSQWPVRMAVVRHRGVPTHRVLTMCHLVTDAHGAGVLVRELAGEADGADPAVAWHPLDQVRWQGSPAGQRVCQAARRRWEGVLRSVPARRFRGSADRREPRHWQGRLDSVALLLAARTIAARTGVTSSLVLLALFAAMQTRLTGVNPAVMQVVVSNRFRTGLARSVSVVNQTGLCVLDLAGRTVDQAVRYTRGRAMAAYKHAYYHPDRMAELVARVSRERGEEIDLGCYFNDRRIRYADQRSAPAGPPPAPEQLAAALAGTTFRWEQWSDKPFESLFVHIEDVPDRIAALVYGDTHRVSPADLEAWVRGMEELAVTAALDPATRTGVD